MADSYDVVVVGGGHAGCEAASASARAGAKTALVTLRRDTIGTMSCNPAIGGLGKGHLVREIDALDGLMGRVADEAGIQFRLLNRRKGPAVRGPRTQADRKLYRLAMQAAISQQPNLDVVEREVFDFVIDRGRVIAVVLADGRRLDCAAVVLTTGTFLRGLIHIGERKIVAGRMNEQASMGLSETLKRAGLRLGRLKTGTPPRLDGKTIDWASLGKQAAEKGVDFITDFPPGPLLIQGLEGRLAQVFVNLLTNAISFCEDGDAVRLWVRRRENRVLVVVEDTGPGIPEQALTKIFKRFYSERPPGQFGEHSGLGLAISKQIVEAHGGVIWAENIRPTDADPTSDPLGARFVVGLPV